MILRDFFPKQPDFLSFPAWKSSVQEWLNERPQKALNWFTLKERFKELLLH